MLDWFSFCFFFFSFSFFFCLNRVLLLPLVWQSSQSVSCFSLEYGNTSPKVSINGGLLLNIIKLCVCVCVCVCVCLQMWCAGNTLFCLNILFSRFSCKLFFFLFLILWCMVCSLVSEKGHYKNNHCKCNYLSESYTVPHLHKVHHPSK